MYLWIDTPLGPMAAQEKNGSLTGLWFRGQRHFGLTPDQAGETPALRMARQWVSAYFAKAPLPPLPPLAPQGTAFQQRVWQALRDIPPGQTVTYGHLAGQLASSPRAVGGAVGRNPLSLVIPCHRVVGAGGQLTGYAGGVARKAALLALEAANERTVRDGHLSVRF